MTVYDAAQAEGDFNIFTPPASPVETGTAELDDNG